MWALILIVLNQPISWLHGILRYLDTLTIGRLKCISNLHVFLSNIGETAGLPHHISKIEDIVYLFKVFISMTKHTCRKKDLVCTIARSEKDRYVPSAQSFPSRTHQHGNVRSNRRWFTALWCDACDRQGKLPEKNNKIQERHMNPWNARRGLT